MNILTIITTEKGRWNVSAFHRRVGMVLGLTSLVFSLLACNLGNTPLPTPVVAEPTELPANTASINGIVWHDLCVNDSSDEEPPQGCVKDDHKVVYIANGIYESNEEGISGILVELGSGPCPATSFTSVSTDTHGQFKIENLTPGVYCAFPRIEGSHLPALVEPGIWTYPKSADGSSRAMQTITLLPGEQRSNVNFGWDYLNKPVAPMADPTREPTSTPRCVDSASLVKDVTIPDGTRMEPGESFTKTWRMRNTGTCTWTDEYELIFLSGHHMDSSTVVSLKGNVAPGQVVDLSVAMKAPKGVGTYWGYWILRNEQDAIFGLGENANGPVWVKILVEPDITDWRGEYYNNRKLDGDPVLVRNDEEIDFNWKKQAPSTSLPSDDFSVRWTRELKFEDDIYRFSFLVDDGVRLWVDDRLVLDEWEMGSVREVSVKLQMEKGKHDLQVEFFERGGHAQISMDIDKTTVSTGQHWNGTYWFNRTMDSKWALIKSVDTLDFDWGSGSPAQGLPKDDYSIRWKRTVEFDPGVYRFYARADDGIWVEIDDDRIIDEWHTSNASETYTAEVSLSGLHELQVEYYEQSGKAKIAFWWEYLGPQNRHPVANSDDYETVADEVLIVAEPGVMSNDQDPDGDNLIAALVTGPLNGMIVLNEDGSFEYQPTPGFTGEDIFTYRVSDGEMESNDALVMITVLPSNTPPTASNDTFEGPEGEPIDIPAPGVLENDVDDESQELKAYLEAEPTHGSIILRQDGSFLYSPEPEYIGTDEFTYQVSDGRALSNIAIVTITLKPKNAPPLALDDVFAVEEDGALVVVAPGIMKNDVDPEGQSLVIILETSPGFGDLTLGEDGAFEYKSHPDFNGDDAFSYRVSDGEGISEIANVQIHVSPVNDFPQAINDEVSGIQDQALEIEILSNDIALGDAPISIIIETMPINGNLEILGNTILYTPSLGFFGEDLFSYSVMDQDGEYSRASVLIDVSPFES
jgi:hypothetical protein